jgi:acyl-CoA reductase-like NAD-dependent aldehyde dehydrogenase
MHSTLAAPVTRVTKYPPIRNFIAGQFTAAERPSLDVSSPSDGTLLGPVLAIIRARDVNQALAIENSSPYGNAAAVFIESGGLARYVAEHASAGMVGVNVGVPVPREPFSFGGWNESKFGVGDITGPGSIEFWTRTKKTTVRWGEA